MKRKKRLSMQKKAAEDALRCQKELLKKEAELRLEEQRINELITEALSCQQMRLNTTGQAPVSSRTLTTPHHPLTPPTASLSVVHGKESPSGLFHAMTTSTPLSSSKMPSSVPEEVEGATSSDVVEELLTTTSRRSVPSASASYVVSTSSAKQYATDTFESDGMSLGATLTQLQDLPGSMERDSGESLVARYHVCTTNQFFVVAYLLEGDSVSVTSEGSELELRVRRLRESVLQRERELKKREMEQRKRKKALLRKEEELLQSRLKVLARLTNLFILIL